MTIDNQLGRPPYRRIAPAALYFAALISFLGSISWIFHRDRLVTSIFQFCFAASVSTWLLLIVGRVWQLSRAAIDETAAARHKVYSFPRRFGLGTLLVLTLVFGALSAYFRSLEWPGELVLAALCFVGLISAMQFAFERAPRHVSVLVGSLVFAAWPILWRMLGNRSFVRYEPLDIAFFSAICAILGALIGYCTGTLVGGIFLSMDAATAFFKKTPKRQSDQV
jgi:hypothetical protein